MLKLHMCNIFDCNRRVFVCRFRNTESVIVAADKILASQTLLASFGCCRSPMNTNASKFTQIISLEFDYAGVITGGSIQGKHHRNVLSSYHEFQDGSLRYFASVYG